jgi:LCP family protein required for cell wall assembly
VKRARPKGKKKAENRLKNRAETYDVSTKITENYEETETPAQDNGDYSEIIDAIRKEKSAGYKAEPSKKKKRPKKSAKKVLLTLICILIFLFVALMGMNLFDDSDILAPLENGKINILMLGVDESGLRTDAIMVASYDVNEGEVNLLSIPRDTKVYISDKKITRKINAVHALSSGDEKGKILGVQASAEAVTQLTGIPINYYVEFSFLSIDHLFDSLGGVEYDVPDVEGKGRGMNYDDPYQNLHIHLKPGMQTLTGNQVQQFLRYRKSNYHVGTGSDTDRVKRQQDFIKAVLDQKMNITLLTKLPSIYSQLSKEIKTNISMGDVTKYIRYLNKLSGDGIKSFSLPGEDKTIGGASYFVCDLAVAKTLLQENFDVTGEISDRIVLSGKNPHKPLVAGNMTKAESDYKAENVQKPQEEPKKEEKTEEVKAPEPEKEKEKEPETGKQQPPPVEPNKTPLEDIYTLD